jgi:type I restriction enzyme, S subunit
LRPDPSIALPLYLYYWFSSEEVRNYIIGLNTGSSVPLITLGKLRSVPINLPPLPIQRKIASILSAYDDLIEINLRRIKILEEMAQNLYREWFVKFRFPGHEKVRFVNSELGKIPEGWEVRNLGDVCHLTMGQSPKSEFYNSEGRGLPFHQGVSDFNIRYPSTRLYCTVMGRIAEKGDILFSVRAPVGRINIANIKMVIGRGLSAIRSKSGYQWYTFHFLKESFKEEDTIGGGTIFKSVTKGDMEQIPFMHPSECLIEQFDEIAGSMGENIKNLIKRNTILRQTRDLLLPKLISGELDVSQIDINMPEEVEI